ncbi:lanthionine synthetase C family protein [Streptomyces oceani]|uniref:Lanthionine synthetase n=1 Tax=Streptomyces oceani TaxID=1075402 RepID=A0A1E7KJ33_9ACTN|nr:lanthionine synthetase C family protein [Streptomyces oceani]OEV03896.1 hypothetical protein AN216_09635 [Streptomyces oceani]
MSTETAAETAPSSRPELRARAAGVVSRIAERLRDPDAVVAATTASGTHAEVADTSSPVWEPGSLNRGYPALALLHAELGRDVPTSAGDPTPGRDLGAHRTTAHRYLELSAASTSQLPVQGAFAGVGALASATRVAAAHQGEYASLLRRTDARMADYAHRLTTLHASTRDAGLPTYPAVLDVLSGLSGVGRYLLHRRTSAAGAEGDPDTESRTVCDVALGEAIASLVSLRTPLRVRDTEVPGWWYGPTKRTLVAEEFADGQVNFGLGHGVPGPLGLLSLAWSAGVRRPGQAEAIEELAEWLLTWREQDEAGAYWTPYLPLRYYADRHGHVTPQPARPSWCYGAAGTARALGMAGRALDRPDWTEAGVAAVRAMVRRPLDGWGIHDHAMCHGWSSVLYLLLLFELDHPEAELSAVTDEVARRLLSGFDPAAPFGYRYYQPAADLELDMPGFLDGASGIALALHAYAGQRPAVSGWDTLLLLN